MWSVYILRCKGNRLYTGVSNNIVARLQRHNAGTGAAFTRAMRPCTLLWHEHHPDRANAQKREAQIKSWPKGQKEAFLVEYPHPCSKCQQG